MIPDDLDQAVEARLAEAQGYVRQVLGDLRPRKPDQVLAHELDFQEARKLSSPGTLELARAWLPSIKASADDIVSTRRVRSFDQLKPLFVFVRLLGDCEVIALAHTANDQASAWRASERMRFFLDENPAGL